MKFLYANFFEGALTAVATAEALTLTVAPSVAAALPAPASAGERVALTIYDGVQDPEIVYCSSNPGTGVLTVERQQESTVAVGWGIGSRIRVAITKGTIDALSQLINFTTKLAFTDALAFLPDGRYSVLADESLTGSPKSEYSVTANVATLVWVENAVNVYKFGALGIGSAHDDTAAFSAMVAVAGHYYVPDGSWNVALNTISLASGVHLWISPGATFNVTNTTTMDAAVFLVDGVSDVSIDGGKLVSNDYRTVMVKITGLASRVFVRNVQTREGRIVMANSSAAAYADINETNSPIDIHTSNCEMVNTTFYAGVLTTGRAGIHYYYVRGGTIQGNVVRGGKHGIEWTGGNAATDGELITADRKVKDIIISGNRVYDIHDGGIWGAMGQDITVANNHVYRCGDVGLDFEGCIDYLAIGNTVVDARNGCLAIFYTCRGGRIQGNKFVQTGTWVEPGESVVGTRMFKISVSNSSGNNDAEIVGNDFEWHGPTGYGDMGNGYLGNFTFSRNTLRNVACSLDNPSWQNVRVEGNRLRFTQAITDADVNLLAVGRPDPSSSGIAYCNDNEVYIETGVTMPSGTVGIKITAGASVTTYSEACRNKLINNGSALPGGDFVIAGGSGSTDRYDRFIVHDNIVPSITDLSAQGGSLVEYRGNRTLAGLPLPNIGTETSQSLPTAGGFAANTELFWTTITGNTQGVTVRVDSLALPNSAQWAATTAYIVGKYVWLTSTNGTDILRCKTAGTSSSSEPAFGSGDITDGTVVWNRVTLVKRAKFKRFGFLAGPRILSTSSTTITAAQADSGNMTLCTSGSAITITLPNDTTSPDILGEADGRDCFLATYVADGAGQITFAAGAGVTIQPSTTLKTAARYSAITVAKTAANTYRLYGALSA